MSVRAGTGRVRGRGTKRAVFAVQNFMGKRTHEVLYCKVHGRSYSDGGGEGGMERKRVGVAFGDTCGQQGT